MRSIATIAVWLALAGSSAFAAPAPSAKAAALAAGDWRTAAQRGASAADIVRALQARGLETGAVPEESAVTIGADNQVDVVALQPLPPLPADIAASGRTAGLSGSGFTFAASRAQAIILYPADAATFAVQGQPFRR
jgi:hypothetical protein